MHSTAPILVIGSTGKIGSRLLTRLSSAGIPTRGVSRSTTPAFSWDDATNWSAAFEGVRVAFVAYAPDLAEEGAPERIAALTETAKAAGVERIVLLSGRGECNAIRSEEILRQSGLGFTVVRASWFNQNFSEGHLLPSVLAGFLALPAGDIAEPFIDVEDIADVAYAALTDDRHQGQVYDVTGPRLTTFAEAASMISAASGRPIAYMPISLEDFHAALLPEVGQRHADLLRDLCSEVLDGRNQSVTDGVERALGRKPRDFADFVRDMAATGVWSSKAA